MQSPSCPMHQKGTSFSLQKGSMRQALSKPTHYIGRIHPVVKDQDAPSRFKQKAAVENVSECHHILFVIDKSYGI